MNYRTTRLPAYVDARSSEELAIALVREDEKVIQEWRRRVALNESRRQAERVRVKYERSTVSRALRSA